MGLQLQYYYLLSLLVYLKLSEQKIISNKYMKKELKQLTKIFKILLIILPLLFFIVLSITLYLGLKRENPNELPSVFIGKQAPEFNLSSLPNKDKPTKKDLQIKKIKLVNFWASWCPPCRVEHKFLNMIQESGHMILGVNYKDSPVQATKFLTELGDPYFKVGADRDGRTGINWGLYGVPETFVIDNTGTILFRNAGPITSTIYNEKILPLLNNVKRQEIKN